MNGSTVSKDGKHKRLTPPLKIKSLRSEVLQQIKLGTPFEAFQMMGAYVAPDENTKEQVEILTKIAKKWAHNITKSYLSPHEALKAYVQVLFPALVYPVAAMLLTEAECDKIVQSAIKAPLNRINMPLTTARTLLYGPSRYDRLELPNLYVYGNTLKIMMLMGHLQKCDATEPILRISLGNIQQQVGISRHVLEVFFSKYSFLAEHYSYMK